jgi:hypothetical protein
VMGIMKYDPKVTTLDLGEERMAILEKKSNDEEEEPEPENKDDENSYNEE